MPSQEVENPLSYAELLRIVFRQSGNELGFLLNGGKLVLVADSVSETVTVELSRGDQKVDPVTFSRDFPNCKSPQVRGALQLLDDEFEGAKPEGLTGREFDEITNEVQKRFCQGLRGLHG